MNYYVSKGGSDSNNGAVSSPWQTITHAAATMQAGDVCLVDSGDYPERVQVASPGLAFEADGVVNMQGFTVNADDVVVRGFDISNTPDHWQNGWGIFVEKGHNILIEDNYVHYCTRGGINVWAEPGYWTDTYNCIVRNNRCYRNAQNGVEVHGRNNLVEDNEIWGTIQRHPASSQSSGRDADGIRFHGQGHIIRRNHIHDITFDDPENVNPHIDGFQTFASSWHEVGHDVLIEGNFVDVMVTQALIENGHGFMLEGASDIVIKNNIIKAFRTASVSMGSSNIQFLNNTLVSDLSFTDFYPRGIGVQNASVVVKNNIFYNVGPTGIPYVDRLSGDTVDISHNCVFMSDGRMPGGSPYPNDLWEVDPQFVDPEHDNYHLLSDSPCIGAGENSVDIGAYQFMSLLQRIIGGPDLPEGQAKISPHVFSAALAEYKRGSITGAQFAAALELNATEITQLQNWLANIDALPLSTYRQKVEDVLYLGEAGLYPLAKCKTELGITE